MMLPKAFAEIFEAWRKNRRFEVTIHGSGSTFPLIVEDKVPTHRSMKELVRVNA
ncbi:hypothetical protein RchiOBHm_Chr1g0323211 [Rosa chinensis]|uniref:Uncharacterized protein n=1 Tax=Rosa chinensis TaxID=74649 RepID=A0A2P6S9E5_ROSCH|nr:hypothetical protein RchiOBHm_Chr1g0323211 [Rosa chinensis]